ncbi:RimJ/RimL family protein N-acetyltransferase [Cytobacillus oceanisediminis]|jgi:RimJ/RimL family protein N-acetyltransferase|uniref:RimJ/RimL family protein N-acetyltransferase n=1 Tax=Cytobacillus oceanisediminis TaxID=665099 RepID=A0A2V2ZMR0_9BACI|nr:GNAT family N-acetyltransferase [Cytobacillus oceanisediminis]PWW25565.1 RimJ/RimL family protein N-acetyltransferase [Cytobacillus oceanisediminis]
MKTLEANHIILRRLTLDDAEKVEEYASDYDVAKTTLNIPHPYPKGAAKEFITSILEAEKNGKIAIFAITLKENNSLIGLINISGPNVNRRAEIGYWIGKPFWGKGYGTEAAKAVIKYGFEEMNHNRIYALAFTDNPGSWRIMEKAGMKHEGVFRQHAVRDGKPVDLTYYAILQEEYTG